MSNLYISPSIFLLGIVLALVGIGTLIPWLKSRQIFDRPNDRSSHSQPTVKGAGLVLVGLIVVIFLLIDLDLDLFHSSTSTSMNIYVLIAVTLLAVISWLDDLYGLSVILRLFIQVLIVAGVLATDHERVNLFPTFVPWWLCFLFILSLWCGFTNIFNFMDGIDGISGVESISICLGIVILAAANGWIFLGQDYALVIAGVSLGFLWWNWQPAKVFLGDVGSIPLGFLIAWLLLGLAAKGFYMQAIILPLYYLVDAMLTITIRLFTGKKVWAAHRDHFYQQAVQGGLSHNKVSFIVALLNGFLIGFALLALYFPLIGLFAALIVVCFTLTYFGTRKKARL